MGAQRTSFEKLQRDRAKKAKQALKREKRLEKGTDTGPGDDAVEGAEMAPVGEAGELSAADLLRLVEQIHRQFDNEEITYEEFEDKKTELFARLPID